MLPTTAIVTYSCFVMNFVYYGALYAFPQVLPHMSKVGRTMTPAMDLMVGAFWEFPGYILAIVLTKMLSRRAVTKLYCVVCGISMMLFIFGFYFDVAFLWHAGFYGVKCFVCT